MPLNVLFLMEDLCFGGTQKQNLALANGLDRLHFRPQILTLTGPTDLDDQVATDIPLVHLGAKRGVAPLFFFRMGKVIKRLVPDVIIPCTALPNIWGRIWGMLLKIPVILGTCRGGGAPVRQHERFLWRLSSHIVCNSSALVEAMKERGAPAGHLSYIPNGVDCGHFHPAKKAEKDPLILCVARLSPDKDLPTLLKAFEMLAESDSRPRLRIVGEGSEEGKLRQIIRGMSKKIADRIELAGACADPAHHYREADLFVLSSIREGQPNVILEAMSSALPVCATATGGIPDLLGQEEGGCLSLPGDAPALAENMARILSDSVLQKRMGSRNRHFAQNNFSFEKMISRHEELLKNLWRHRSGQNAK